MAPIHSKYMLQYGYGGYILKLHLKEIRIFQGDEKLRTLVFL